jgi:transposase
MTRQELNPPDAVLVAIDVSKLRNDVLIEVPGKTRRRRLVVPNTKLEHDRFVDLLRGLGKPVIAGFEATGNYHRPLAFRLLEEGIALRLVSSVALARTREALHNGWDKNDPKDAQVILHMLRIGATQTYLDPIRAGINDIQELSKTHEIVSKAKTELWHRLLTHYLPLYFPEVVRFAGNSRSDWFLAFLEAFPIPACIAVYEKDAFIDAAWDVVGKKVSKARLLGDIYETAQASIGLPVGLDSPAITMFRMIIAEGRSLIRQRDEIEKQAHAALADNADYRRLRQIPG